MEININLSLEDTIAPVYRPLINESKMYKVIFGGRGSGKTYFAEQLIILSMLYRPGRNAIVLRKVKTNARSSVFKGIIARLREWDLLRLVDVNQTTMTITFPNGNQIMAGGLDDPDKWKSVAFENGKDLTDIWFEEGDQITPKDFETLNFTLRGETPNIVFTFNPVNKQSWIYKEFFENPGNQVITLQTSYLDNPFLPDSYHEKMEELKRSDPEQYNIIGLGNWGNLSNVVYRNYHIDNFNYEDEYYDFITWGLDFGWNDATALIKVGVKGDTIYVIDEIYVNGTDIEDFVKLLKDEGIPRNAVIWADHSPDKHSYMIKKGYRGVRNALKNGKEAGVSALRNKKIIIHPRCSNFIKEISVYSWRVDKNGNVLDKLVDGFDHALDAFLYSLREWINKRMGKHGEVSVKTYTPVRHKTVNNKKTKELGKKIKKDAKPKKGKAKKKIIVRRR